MSPYKYATQTAKELVYKHMKMNDIKSKNYTYHSFFDYYSKEFNILSIESKLNHEISGFLIKKSLFPSIFYQKDHYPTKQNFTKCHELGHILLNHDGYIFSGDNENKTQEYEANYFASFVLAPDIVLLFNIVYENKTFKQIMIKLEISKECLMIRLFHLLKDYTKLDNNIIDQLVTDFQSNKNIEISLILFDIKENIIIDYKDTIPSNFELALFQLNNNHFINSFETPELSNSNFQQKLLARNQELLFNSYFNYGKNVIYAWHSSYYNQQQAFNKIKHIQFNKHFSINTN